MIEKINNKDQLRQCLLIEKNKYHAHWWWFLGKRYFEQDKLYCFNWCLRHYEYYKNTNRKFRSLIFHLIHNRQEMNYRIYIGPNQCGVGLKIMHLGTILFNGNAIAGKNLSIHINTCLVARGTNSEAPVLGDDIVIGVNSVVCGGVHLANGIAVGANSFVNKSFNEENITIAGSPALKVSTGGKNKWGNSKNRLL